ncbi:MAG: hypothetical protein WAZ34_05885 [Rhodocyclaceae bacterium]
MGAILTENRQAPCARRAIWRACPRGAARKEDCKRIEIRNIPEYSCPPFFLSTIRRCDCRQRWQQKTGIFLERSIG